jgi:hypothetical protein
MIGIVDGADGNAKASPEGAVTSATVTGKNTGGSGGV